MVVVQNRKPELAELDGKNLSRGIVLFDESEAEPAEAPKTDAAGTLFQGPLASLRANPPGIQGDGAPMKREELYDRTCLR